MIAGFIFSLVLVGAALAVPSLRAGESPSPFAGGSEPVGPIDVVQALGPVDLGDPGQPQPGAPAPGPSPSAPGRATPVDTPASSRTPAGSTPAPTAQGPPAPAPAPPPAPTGPCDGQAGNPLAVSPDPVNLASGIYRGSFTIHHCAQGGTNWTTLAPPAVTLSAQSGTLEGPATQRVNFTVDAAGLSAGPFHLRVRVSTSGQNIYVDIEGSKPAVAGVTNLGTGSGDS